MRRRMFANRSSLLLRMFAVLFLMSALAGMFAVWGAYQSAANNSKREIASPNGLSTADIRLQKQEHVKSPASSSVAADTQKKNVTSSSSGSENKSTTTVTTNGKTVRLRGDGDVEKRIHERSANGKTDIGISIHSHSNSNSSTTSSSNMQINVDSSSEQESSGE